MDRVYSDEVKEDSFISVLISHLEGEASVKANSMFLKMILDMPSSEFSVSVGRVGFLVLRSPSGEMFKISVVNARKLAALLVKSADEMQMALGE